MKIYKYPLRVANVQTIEMPYRAELLCVALQYGEWQLWARVIPGNPLVGRRIIMAGTGQNVPYEPYIGTVFHDGFVWHFFDGGSPVIENA